MILHYFNEYLELIEENGNLQLDGALCFALGKTPSQLRKLEDDGFLSYEEKVFLWAYLRYQEKFRLENHVSLF